MHSWNATTHFCQWYGVTCGHRHQRVKVLDLQSLKLTGSISPHIGNISFLRKLILQNNSFSHEIPPEIGRLCRLQVLQLFNNSIGGTIPSNISACFNLASFDISNNKLMGSIPPALGRLPNLQEIYIYKNNLTGTIPSSLGNLSSLVILSIGSNNLVGSFSNILGQLKNLIFLPVNINKLSGIIPPSIFNLSSITILSVGYNQIHGNLPSNIGITLPNLEALAISNNSFTGTIPASISNASNLVYLDSFINEFTGEVPYLEKLHKLQLFGIAYNLLGSGGAANDLSFLCSLTNTTSLKMVEMGRNNFGGPLPECMRNFTTSLAKLAVEQNQIFGSIPTWIGNFINLEILAMEVNSFSGHIPVSIGRLQKLQILYLLQNNLSGNIPSSLGNLTRLIEFNLRENNLQGSIPSSLQKCTNLLKMDLSLNNLSGAIPSEVISLSSLSIYVHLSNNKFIGALPTEVGNLKNLGELDMSENMLSGDIPSSLGGCVRLERLYMQGNLFEGQIPSSLSSVRGLQPLGFSRNNLSSEIPKFLTTFDSLKNLNLSYNNFESIVPIKGIFANASATSVMGNSKLCGGIPEFQLPICNFQTSKKRGLTFILKLIIAIISGLLGVFLVLSSLLFFWFKKKRKEIVLRNYEKSLLKVFYQNLFKATNEFSSANLIGVGSFGSVYKGILDEDGVIIAVKVFDILRRGASKSFITECEALRNIRHRNLVKVLTACSGVDYHGNDFKALVYEFMNNGSLDDWLHPPYVGINEAGEAPRSLNLLQRLNIVIDVACALEYLHHHCVTPIAHCDLKPSNVLLNYEMTGHLSDFGLAKLISDRKCYSTNQSSSVGLRGTIGYALSEYGIGSEVSIYGDVYSYGILLLEMFTGKRPTDDMFKEGLSLHSFVKVALPERVAENADPIILQERVEVEMSRNNTHNESTMRKSSNLQFMNSIFRIGISCSVDLPRDRMNISDVAAKLHSIRDKLLRSRLSHHRQLARSTL